MPIKLIPVMKNFYLVIITMALLGCNTEDYNLDDVSLIEKIELASKVEVDASSIPTVAQATLNQEFGDSFIESIQLAEGLGYKVIVDTFNESKVEAKSNVYFSEKGRSLNDTDEKRMMKRQKCFEFVFPLDFIMPDDTSITLKSKEDWNLVKEWYSSNSSVKARPQLSFPVDIKLEDGTIQTLLDRDELMEVKKACALNQNKRKCFEFQLPVSFTMPDNSIIVVNKRADFLLIRRWHLANPKMQVRASLNLPVVIKFQDGTSKGINSLDELKAAKAACGN